ncbi:LTA synthase family protein [Macrococcoides canis]|uniref:LTA synthase family protein n=1 Tax=Macrococcoides canis TaxID=1855823 RepID=UPI001F48AFAC|nr:sulfatase-like hydrolase/transferase [Macrococcus canis]UJS28543.1 sulfatase-like hydrolase/transferase [Macrococcus canis]WBF52216.1 sulfatase-like hydrolase/transferase [Macrococcus canis]
MRILRDKINSKLFMYYLLMIITFYISSKYWIYKLATIIFNQDIKAEDITKHAYSGTLIIFSLFLILYLFSNSGIASLIAGNVICYIFYFANYMKFKQRGELITFYELREIKNIKSLSDLVSLNKIFLVLGLSLIIIILIIIFENKIKRKHNIRPYKLLKVITIILLFLVFLPFSIDSERYTAKIFGFNSKDEKNVLITNNPKQIGIVPFFLNSISRVAMEKPPYNKEDINRIRDKYTKLAEVNNKSRVNDIKDEHTIIYLSESLWDSDKLLTNGPAFPFIKSMKTLYGGNMYSPYIGGGTGNIEFSVLTSMSLELHKNEKLTSPYVEYFGQGGSSASVFSLVNKDKRAVMHPYNFSYYNRLFVYDKMQISSLYDESNLKYKDKLPGSIRISDYSFTNDILDKVSRYSIISAISMQNHSPYTSKIMSQSDFTPQYQPGILAEKPNGDAYGDYVGIVNGYFRGVRETDDAILSLIHGINKKEEKINLILYGDHSPSFVRGNEKQLGDVVHKTPYFIYQNHKPEVHNIIEEAPKSPIFLIPQLLERGQYKMPPFYYLMNEMAKRDVTRVGKDYVYINGLKHSDKDINEELLTIVNDYRILSFDRFFGNNKIGDEFYYKY